MSAQQTVTLFDPITIGRHVLHNRAVITTHNAFRAAYLPGTNLDQALAYLERRVRGGPGMVVLQTVAIGTWDLTDVDALGERLARFGEMAHGHDVRVLVQIVHPGLFSAGEMAPDMRPAQAFASVPRGAEVAHAMSTDEVHGAVAAFADAARVAAEAGLDGIELHGAHGYLLHQSLNTTFGRRDDEWAEPFAFWRSVLGRVRDALGPDRIVCARIPADDHGTAGGLTHAQCIDAARQLVATGLIDVISPTEGGTQAQYNRVIGGYSRPPGDFLESIAAIRAGIDCAVPVVAVGRILDPEQAERALARGACDLVGVTRAHIADPDFLVKARAGESHRIRRCVGANQGCIDRILTMQPMSCFVNPEVGEEHWLPELRKAARPERVLVIGGGPAGMKAAEMAARRGHAVTLAERSPSLGGRLAAITADTPARELVESVRWVARELAELGVTVATGVTVDRAYIERAAPTAIVVATGSVLPASAPPSDGSVPVLATDEAIAAAVGGRVASVLVLDALGNEEVEVTCEQLAGSGVHVTLVSPNPVVGAFLGFTHRLDYIERLLAMRVAVEERTTVRIEHGEVVTTSQLTGRSETRRFDAVVAGVPRMPADELVAVARDCCDDVRVVGDALAPRNAMLAFREGDRAGRSIGQLPLTPA